MHFRTLLLVAIVALTAGFAALNWAEFTTPQDLSIGITTVYAPIGAIMLVVLGILSALFLAWVIYLQGTVLLDMRRQAKELQASRELADRAEASRFTELRNFMSAELLRVTQANDEAQYRVIARIEQLEQRSRMHTEQTGNTLSAYIGELEDRLAHPGSHGESRNPFTGDTPALPLHGRPDDVR